jgi:hypothetical protein
MRAFDCRGTTGNLCARVGRTPMQQSDHTSGFLNNLREGLLYPHSLDKTNSGGGNGRRDRRKI